MIVSSSVVPERGIPTMKTGRSLSMTEMLALRKEFARVRFL